jgi:hypothetical protein
VLPQDKARLSQFIQQKAQQEDAHAATDQPPGHVLTPWSDLAKRTAPQAAEQERKDRVARKEWVSGFVKACIEDTAPLISLDESIEAHKRCYNFLNIHPIPEAYPAAFYNDKSHMEQCQDYCPKTKTK